jgi:hypothetical protein
MFTVDLRKTTKTYRQDRRYPSQDSNRSYEEYKLEAISRELACSIFACTKKAIPVTGHEGPIGL